MGIECHLPLFVTAPYGVLPVYASNPALVCAPTNQTATPCRLLPASLYSSQYAAGLVPFQACTNSATGPLSGAVKCSSDGICATLACGGLQFQIYNSVFGPGG